jgi:hypothetical protein
VPCREYCRLSLYRPVGSFELLLHVSIVLKYVYTCTYPYMFMLYNTFRYLYETIMEYSAMLIILAVQ